MYINSYTYIHINTCMHMSYLGLRNLLDLCICVYIRTCVDLYRYTSTHVCRHNFIYSHAYIYTHTQQHVSIVRRAPMNSLRSPRADSSSTWGRDGTLTTSRARRKHGPACGVPGSFGSSCRKQRSDTSNPWEPKCKAVRQVQGA